MESKKVYLDKEYVKVIELRYSIMQVTFENAFKKVEFFHPRVKMLRKKIHYNKEIMDGKVVILIGNAFNFLFQHFPRIHIHR